jgi:hypothetical protein
MGCLTGTGGVADEAERLIETFAKPTKARVLYHDDPGLLIEACLEALEVGRKA